MRPRRETLVFLVRAVKTCLTTVVAFLGMSWGTPAKADEAPKASNYPWHRGIVTTYFWIGRDENSITTTTNFSSAWDDKWMKNYGGSDANHAGLLPTKFAPTQNPFYVALPFNDIAYPDLAKKYVPWFSSSAYHCHPYVSQCKGRWVEIRSRDSGKIVYAQWQDVGPLRTDHVTYVFGDDKPHDFNHAGLDVSPAVRDCLGLSGLDSTDWRFVEDDEVPAGPWRTYAEQAIVYAALKQREAQIADDWHPANKRTSPTIVTR
jgi:hypothetical protein